MLSGRAPFHARSRDDSAAAIMSRIKEGDFNFNAEAWHNVSHAAKQLTKGMARLRVTIFSLSIVCRCLVCDSQTLFSIYFQVY